ncbi:MAG TPA: TetR family transcriptional regulator [Acidimicrobiales bacterium]
MSETIGRRERKKAQTRRALTAAAIRLSIERGSPDRVTVEEISEAADVSPRTFVNYFSSKEDAVLGVDPERRTELRAELELRPADEAPIEALRAALLSTAESIDENAELWAQRMQLVRDHPTLSAGYVASFADFERGMVEAMAARLDLDPDTDIYPALVVATALTITRVTVKHWQATDADTPLADLLDRAFEQLADGLTLPPP